MTEQTTSGMASSGHSHPIQFKVDGETETTLVPELTPAAILRLASIDPTTHYLVQLDGRHRVSYEGKEDTPIQVHEGATFISVSTGPTPVS